ncbi:MAG: hypothetical protein WB586_13805 [Chthoniobacterales bacterium]
MSEAAIPLAREGDQTNSPEAIARLSKVVDECLALALRTGNADMIAAAQRAFDHIGKISIAPELERLLERMLVERLLSPWMCPGKANARASRVSETSYFVGRRFDLTRPAASKNLPPPLVLRS